MVDEATERAKSADGGKVMLGVALFIVGYCCTGCALVPVAFFVEFVFDWLLSFFD